MKDGEYKNHVIQAIQALARVELERANHNFPRFRSPHEGWAVMLEEFKEAHSEIKDVKAGIVKDLWSYVSHDKKVETQILDCIEYGALNAVCELIQVIAMKYKFENLIKED